MSKSSSCPRCGLAHAALLPCPLPVMLPLPDRPAPLLSGSMVGGRFRIKALAHRSGATAVYQAIDARTAGTLVAVKELHVAGMGAEERTEALAWLAREAALLSTLHDPRLPRLLAAFSEGDRHYVVMPFLQGETLEQRVQREGPQPELQVLRWGQALAELLHYLHTQDPPIVHRDIKPANVMLRPDGEVVLLDLGVARPLQPGGHGTAVGTPGYAPPEQYQGRADERSDLYALGATLHRALTGYDAEQEPPFRHPPVRALNGSVSEGTSRLVDDLLQIAPQRRPARAQTVRTFLRVASRIAYREAYGPVHAMYRRLLAGLALAIAAGAIVRRLYFGVPTTAVSVATTTSAGDWLRVCLVFAPGLCLAIPLLRAGIGTTAHQRRVALPYRCRAALVVGATWAAALGSWLWYAHTGRWGELEAAPQLASPVTWQIVLAIICAVVGLLLQWRETRRSLRTPPRTWLPNLLLAYFLLVWLLLLALPASPNW